MGTRPLEGIRVADFGWIYAVPHATAWLGALGADVIRIETSGAPDLVRFLTGTDGSIGANRSGVFHAINSSRRSIALNLAMPEAQEIARKIIRRSDFVTENFTVGNMAKYNLAYDDLVKIKPDIIMLSGTPLGQDGPLRRQRGLWADDAGLRRAVPYHGLSRFVSVRDRRNVAGLRGGHRHGVLSARGVALSRSDRRGAVPRPVDGRDGYDHDARSDDGFSDERARPGRDWESRRVDGAAWRVPGGGRRQMDRDCDRHRRRVRQAVRGARSAFDGVRSEVRATLRPAGERRGARARNRGAHARPSAR